MADHTGGQRSVVNPDTKLWRPPLKGNPDLVERIQVTVWLNTGEFISVWFLKKRKRAPKLSYFDGRAPQLSARANHGTPAAGVIGTIPRLVTVKTCLFLIVHFIYTPKIMLYNKKNLRGSLFSMIRKQNKIDLHILI